MIRFLFSTCLVLAVASIAMAEKPGPTLDDTQQELLDTVNSFFNLIGEKKIKDAAAMTESQATVTKQLREFQTLAKLQRPDVAKVYANDKVAMIVSNSIQAQQVNMGALIVNAKLKGDEWHIHDMRLESNRDVAKKIDQFRRTNPTARLLSGGADEPDAKTHR